MNPKTLAYLSEGVAYLADAAGRPEPIESPFVEEVRKREATIERRRSWKTQGTGARFMGVGALWDESEGRRAPAEFTFIARGRRPREILYGLSTGVVSGIFAYDVESRQETRLVHGTGHPYYCLATSDEHPVLAFARPQKDGSANIAVMRNEGGEERLVTDGDTLDEAPSWVPMDGSKSLASTENSDASPYLLVFQSTGLGRNAAGQVVGFAPSEINLLDAEQGHLKTIVQDPAYDYSSPRMTAEGILYAIRRPHRRAGERPGLGTALTDGLLAPFRLLYAGFRFLDYFTMRYTGKPLAQSGNTRARRADARRLYERQNLAEADDQPDEAMFRAPADSVLVRRTPRGDESIVAESVMAYDLGPNGEVVVSNGVGIATVNGAGKRSSEVAARQVLSLVRLL